MRSVIRWLREFFLGRPVTKEDILRGRLRICAIAGKRPEEVENFWVGIEDLKDAHQRTER